MTRIQNKVKRHFMPRTKFRFYYGLTLNTANHKVKFRPRDPSLTRSILKEIPLTNKSLESNFFLKEKKKDVEVNDQVGAIQTQAIYYFVTSLSPSLCLYHPPLSPPLCFCEFKWLRHNVRSPGRFGFRVIPAKNKAQMWVSPLDQRDTRLHGLL